MEKDSYKLYLCKLCKCKDSDIIYADKFILYQCKKCGFISKAYTDSIGQNIDGNDIYEKTDNWLKNRETNNAAQNYAKQIYKIYGRYLNGYDLLEIGPGDGWNLRILKEHGYNVLACETSKRNCDYIRKVHNIECINDKFENVKFDNMKFSNILLSHIIEHIDYPIQFINDLKSLLKRNGTIIIITPNRCSFWSRLYGSKWQSYYVPDHVSFFCSKDIDMLLYDMEQVFLGSYEAEHQYFDMLAYYIYRHLCDLNASKTIASSNAARVHNVRKYLKYIQHFKPFISLFGKPFKLLFNKKYGTDLICVSRLR